MKKSNIPLLIIGTQRSGSNLLRLMLNQLPDIEAPHPPHILQTFSPLLAPYGELETESNFKVLVDDIIDFIHANPVPWENIELDTSKIMTRCRKRTLVEIFRVVYETKAEYKNAAYWCCKSMSNVYYLKEIEDSGMRPFYVHLIRDGRDVAASFKNAIVGDKHIYFIARQWKKDQDLASSMRKYAGDRSCMLRYEELISNPKGALEPVLGMLGIQWSDNILNYFLSTEAQNTAAAGEMWRNVVKPIDRNNMRHYSEKLTEDEIAMFEKIAGDKLEFFGYKCDTDFSAGPSTYTEAEILNFTENNEILKREARMKYLLDAKVRAPQEEVVRKIKARK